MEKMTLISQMKSLFTLNAARRAQRRLNGNEVKSHGSGKGVSEQKLGTFTRLLMSTEDPKNGAEGVFLGFLVLADFVFHFMLYQTKYCEKEQKLHYHNYFDDQEMKRCKFFLYDMKSQINNKTNSLQMRLQMIRNTFDIKQDQKSIDAILKDRKHI